MLKVDMKGKRYGRLLVVREAGRDSRGNVSWLCECNHGGVGKPKRLVLPGIRLRQGQTQSCGCLIHETSRLNGKKFLRHGLSNSPLYLVWRNMKARCLNPKNKDYARYGGRGITVCDDWLVSDDFFAWAESTGYQPNLTIERTDNDLGYSPENCYWATKRIQQRNRHDTVMVAICGETKSLIDWVEEYGVVSYRVARERYGRGWNPEEAVSFPVDQHNRRYKTVGGELTRNESTA